MHNREYLRAPMELQQAPVNDLAYAKLVDISCVSARRTRHGVRCDSPGRRSPGRHRLATLGVRATVPAWIPEPLMVARRGCWSSNFRSPRDEPISVFRCRFRCRFHNRRWTISTNFCGVPAGLTKRLERHGNTGSISAARKRAGAATADSESRMGQVFR